MMYSLDSSGLAHMSAACQIEPSSIHDKLSGAGRLNDSPRYPYSSPAKCFTRPSRFVPVGVIGRRRSYSLRLSTLDNSAARLAWSLRCSSSFTSDRVLPSPLYPVDPRNDHPGQRKGCTNAGADLPPPCRAPTAVSALSASHQRTITGENNRRIVHSISMLPAD